MGKFIVDERVAQLHSVEEIEGRPGYRFNVHPGQSTLKAITAWYRLPDSTEGIRCGLSTCHRQHWRGFMVQTGDGSETNIGRNCGKTHFGASFKELTASFDRRERNQRYRDRLNDLLDGLPTIRSRIQGLRDGGGDWLYRAVRSFEAHYPANVVYEVRNRARRGLDVIFRERPRTKEEFEAARAANPNAPAASLMHVQEPVGQIEGLTVFDRSIRDVLVSEIEMKLQELEQLDRNASLVVLTRWNRWADELDDRFAEAESLIEAGRRFFTEQNLMLIRQIAASHGEDRRAMQRIRWDLSTGTIVSQ